MKTLIFHAPPEACGIYSKTLQDITEREPKTIEEKERIISVLQQLLNESEVPFEEKMIYLFEFNQRVMTHSYGLFPTKRSVRNV